MYLHFLLASVHLALGGLISARPAQQVNIETRSLDAIHKAALQESGPLRVAWGGDIKSSGEGIKRAFESRFPGIELELTSGLSKYWDGKIDRAYQTTKGSDDGVDVAVLQSLHDFPRWRDQDRLLPYKVAQWNDIYPDFVDKDGAYMGCYIFSFGSIIYDSDQTDRITLPKTYPAFLDPQFGNGTISLAYPNDDDAILYLFSLITQKHGWDFIYSLAKQNVTWVRGTATPSVLISKSPDDTFSGPSISFASSSAFASGISSAPHNDVYMAWPQTGAIFKSTKHPESAKLFLSFLMADHWQEVIGSSGFATRKTYDKRGVFNQQHMDPLGYARFMGDRKVVEWWRLQFEDILGLPQGIDPNLLDF